MLRRLFAEVELEKAVLKGLAGETSRLGRAPRRRGPFCSDGGCGRGGWGVAWLGGGGCVGVADLMGTLLVREWMACCLVGLGRSVYRCPLQADMMVVPDRALHDTGFVGTRRSTRGGYRCAYHGARGETGLSITRRSSGSGGRRACGSLGVGAANALVPRPSTRRQRPRRTRSGQSISSSTPTSERVKWCV